MASKFKTKITKEEAQHICDKSQYGEASISELMSLNFHLLSCKDSRAYVKRNCKLTSLLKEADFETLSDDDKKSMKSAFQAELAKRS